MRFRNRTEAGAVLAGMMDRFRGGNAIVLALPNGSIPVGIALARALGLEFNLLFVSKITPSFNTEAGYGSVSESGTVVLNESLIRRWGIEKSAVESDIAKTRRKIEERTAGYRKTIPPADVAEKMAILVDDGIASGYTMSNAAEAARISGASRIVIAVPTAPRSSLEPLRKTADEIICPDTRDTEYFAVADTYDEWYDIDAREAIGLLADYVPSTHPSP